MNKIMFFLKKSYIYILLLVLLLSLTTALQNDFLNKLEEKSSMVDKTDKLVILSKKLLINLLTMESSQRGYLLTEKKEYLKPYENASLELYQILEEIDAGIFDSINKERLSKIKKLLEKTTSELAQTLQLAEVDFIHAVELVHEDVGRKYMEDIRLLMDEFVQREYELLDIRQKEFDESFNSFITIFKYLLILFFIVFIYSYKTSKDKSILNRAVQDKTKELEQMNIDLQNEVDRKTEENFKQFQVLQHQNKLASMGEMIGAIAHQWRQPLNELSIRLQKIKYKFAKDEINQEYIEDFIEKNNTTISFMSQTIDDFRNFFRIDKEKQTFDIKLAIEEAISLQNAQLKSHNINISLEGESFNILGFKTEFQHVIVNLISNAKDVLMKRDVEFGQIDIKIQGEKIFLQDNAKGIDSNVIKRVFEPYFTTKEQGEGTGMGLYMSKMIIEDNLNGKLSVQNAGDGALFIIELKTDI